MVPQRRRRVTVPSPDIPAIVCSFTLIAQGLWSREGQEYVWDRLGGMGPYLCSYSEAITYTGLKVPSEAALGSLTTHPSVSIPFICAL